MLLVHPTVHHLLSLPARWRRVASRPVRWRRHRRRGRRLAARALAGLAVSAATTAAAGSHHQAASGPPHRPPVAAPVADPFRPPPHPFAPGNRGIEYDTEPGTVVEASAAGEVVFAGEVAGSRHVTVRHADGVRTSYSFLATIEVVRGQRVRQGDRLGVAGDRLHFGARRGDAYFDPATLFAATTTELELLPFEVPPGASDHDERAALRALTLGSGADVAGGLRAQVVALGRRVDGVHPLPRSVSLTRALLGRLLDPQECTWRSPPPRPVAGQKRVAVLVGGLGSSSGSASIDELRLGDLGYATADTVRFSYRGGRTPDTGESFSSLAPASYGSADTQGDLRVAAGRLADALTAVMAERPGVAVDLFAHSMGGVVTRLALAELDRRGVGLDRLGLVATLGSPHRGADLEAAFLALGTTGLGELRVDAANAALDTGLDPDAPAVLQLAEGSDVVAELASAGVPEGVELVSLAAAGDHVVPSPNTQVDGARNVTVGIVGTSAHGDLVGSDAATDELARALAGLRPACDSALGAVGEEVLGHSVSYTEDLAGAGLAQLPR